MRKGKAEMKATHRHTKQTRDPSTCLRDQIRITRFGRCDAGLCPIQILANPWT